MFAALAIVITGQGFVIPPASQYMSEKEIDEFVVASRTAHYSEDHFDPLWLIQTVNKIQPMGKEKGLSLVREIGNRRVSVGDKIGRDLYWLVNLLFEVPATGQLSPPMLGSITPLPPRDPKSVPRWPIFLESGIPFEPGFMLGAGGSPEKFDAYAARLAAKETWRKELLVPVNDPFSAFERLSRSAGYQELYGRPSFNTTEIPNQIVRLVRSVYQPFGMPRYRMSGDQAMTLFRNQFRSVRARWDKDKQDYVKPE